MELWLSAEVQNDVSEALRQARNRFSKAVMPRLARDYGDDIEEWNLITIVRPQIPEGWGETCEYDRKRRAADFRLIVNYLQFKAASPEEQIQMLIESILRSIDLFPRLNVANFNVDLFRRDIVTVVQSEGWMNRKRDSR